MEKKNLADDLTSKILYKMNCTYPQDYTGFIQRDRDLNSIL